MLLLQFLSLLFYPNSTEKNFVLISIFTTNQIIVKIFRVEDFKRAPFKINNCKINWEI